MDWKPVDQQGGGSGLGAPGKKKPSTIGAFAICLVVVLVLVSIGNCSSKESSSGDSDKAAQTEQAREADNNGDADSASDVVTDAGSSDVPSEGSDEGDDSGDSDSSNGQNAKKSTENDGRSDKKSSTAKDGSEVSSSVDSEEPKEKVLTKKNSKDFATLLKVKDPCSSKVSDFAEAHEGETIKFDGYIADMQHVEGMKTRFNVLIYAAGSPSAGPNFQYNDVNFGDMNVKPDSVDILAADTKVRVTAKVVSYDNVTGLFELDPVETYVRK